MNLRQLQTFCEIVDCGMQISAAAQALHRSQPAITRQLQDLERDLGVRLFARRRNRILELTPHGNDLLAMARRVVGDVAGMHALACDARSGTAGELRIATTHTQARYTLPRVIYEFMSRHAQVKLNLRQGDPNECCELVEKGAVDIAICAEVRSLPRELIRIPCYRMTRTVIVPPRHAILHAKPLTLEAISRYPLITYDDAFSGRRLVDETFAQAGLRPSVALSAVDADVAKSYVQMNVGIAILATAVFDAKRDRPLRSLDAADLFPASVLAFVVRRGAYLAQYAMAFMSLFAPKLRKADLAAALEGRGNVPAVDLPRL